MARGHSRAVLREPAAPSASVAIWRQRGLTRTRRRLRGHTDRTTKRVSASWTCKDMISEGVPMRKVLLAMLLCGTAVAPTASASAEQPQHYPRSSQQQSSRHQATRRGSGQHANQGRSSPQSGPTMRAGTPQHVTHGQSQPFSSSIRQGGAPHQATHGQPSHYSGPIAPRVTGQQVTGGEVTTQHPTHMRRVSPNVGRPVGSETAGQQHRGTGMPRVEHRTPSPSISRVPDVQHGRPPTISSTPRFGTQPPLRHVRHPSARPHWNNNWRYDNRYNWHDYRQRHRSVYHLGHYHDPFGWAYQAFAIGWRLWPGYYSSAYWINDPWMYRLPPAPPGTRWIRYYNDALLVDIYTGEVIDVIHDFFW